MNPQLEADCQRLRAQGYSEADIDDWLACLDNPHKHAQEYIGWRGTPENTKFTQVRYPIYAKDRYR